MKNHLHPHFVHYLTVKQVNGTGSIACIVLRVGYPKIILADEPTGNLDSKNGKEVMDLLTQLNKEGTTVVMVTHSQHDAGYATRTINLFDGQVVNEVRM